MKPGKVLEQARKKIGLELQEVADQIGISLACYRDMEWFEDLTQACELKTYFKVCQLLRLGVLEPFRVDGSSVRPIRFDEFREGIKSHLDSRGIDIDKFAHESGWDLKNFIDQGSVSFIDSFPVMAIQDIAHVIGVDWKSVLLGLSLDATGEKKDS